MSNREGLEKGGGGSKYMEQGSGGNSSPEAKNISYVSRLKILSRVVYAQMSKSYCFLSELHVH